jgi:Zn-dependent peptidase ImmA (M78 family)/transcriptional regulator with XRE-family HTH domain
MVGVGEMLRLARQRIGFTQKQAAARLGIVQPVLSRYENGISDPDDAFLLRASQVFDLPRAFFDLREPVYGPPVSVHPMPRAKADVTARDLDMVTAELNIRVMQMRRFLEGVDFQPPSDLPTLDIERYGSAEKVAAVVRLHWKLPPGPLKNLTSLAERAGIVVGTSDFGGASVSGMTFKVPGQPPLVLLNAHHPADRLRFTLAHEIGHLAMHRFPTPTMEDEANEFASSLLMPGSDIGPAFKSRPRITLELLAALKPEWKVAMQALLVRARTLGYIGSNQYRYLWQQISTKGWRLREPPELDFEHEKPTVLKSIIRNHLEVLGYSIADLCNLVPIHEREFTRMYGPIDDRRPPRPRLSIVA